MAEETSEILIGMTTMESSEITIDIGTTESSERTIDMGTTEFDNRVVSINLDSRPTACTEIMDRLISTPPISMDLDADSKPKYIILLDYVIKNSLHEFSEIFPIFEEKTIVPTSTLLDVYDDIDENWMDFVMFVDKSLIINLIRRLFPYNIYSQFISTSYVSPYYSPVSYPGLLEMCADFDYLNILEEWMAIEKESIMFGDRKVKVHADVAEYYALYKRYRKDCEIQKGHERNFYELVKINLQIEVFQSDF